MERARKGDEDAFVRLCALHEAALRRRIERRLSPGIRRRISSSDVLQEAQMIALGKLADFEDRGDGAFRAWLGRIVDLKTQELIRFHAGAEKRAISGEATRGHRATLDAMRGRGPTPSQVAMGAEMRDAAERAMNALPESYREVIHLIQGEGLMLAEAGERLGKTREAVKGLYARALGRLARALDLERNGQ